MSLILEMDKRKIKRESNEGRSVAEKWQKYGESFQVSRQDDCKYADVPVGRASECQKR